jgi:hypothetical protein
MILVDLYQLTFVERSATPSGEIGSWFANAMEKNGQHDA